MQAEPLLEVIDLTTTFPIKGGILRRPVGHVQAVSGVNFEIRPGETLGLVGESGCGKSTVARTLVGLTRPASGQVRFRGQDLIGLTSLQLRALRRDIQLVFQDPFASLNPHMTVRELVAEGWEVYPDIVPRGQRKQELHDLLERVGLNPGQADRYPHQFSGGQRQRICIARALALRPKLLICDEAVSALDVSIQAQILNLLQELQRDLGLAYLFISHDLAVVRHVSHRVAVMYLGKIVETGPREQLFARPSHPYTQALLSAAPVLQPWAASDDPAPLLEGDLPSPANPPSGCRFRTRCWQVQERCAVEEPVLVQRGEHATACHFAEPSPAAAVQQTVGRTRVDQT
ncbi:MAG: ABC transporter ATP-binding protein [Streptomyces sp.]|uniref:ABC transporter ATP-binding protein n=1 Tax=Streptomyces sp. TaxID=1931 RepID=UPI003D6B928D